MRHLDIQPTPFRVTDFLQWQRSGSLDLNPPFQRRSVWKPENRGFLLDTVVRGLPVPLLFVREVVDLASQQTTREVVDGQQRLRSIFAYVDPSLLEDFDPDRDAAVVKRSVNAVLHQRAFDELDDEYKRYILEYKFAVMILPSEFEDRDVLEIFARLNSTGYKLNHQELRNAKYFGDFKLIAYRLGYEQFERWRSWRVFSDDQLSRMLEVQLVSDLMMNMIYGLTGRSQARLNNIYEEFDDDFPGEKEVASRFRQVMDEIENTIGRDIRSTVYRSEVHFFSLFTYLYDRMWGLGSSLSRSRPKKLSVTLRNDLIELSRQFKEKDVPDEVLDAVERASTDTGRRRARLEYMKQICG